MKDSNTKGTSTTGVPQIKTGQPVSSVPKGQDAPQFKQDLGKASRRTQNDGGKGKRG